MLAFNLKLSCGASKGSKLELRHPAQAVELVSWGKVHLSAKAWVPYRWELCLLHCSWLPWRVSEAKESGAVCVAGSEGGAALR